MRERAGEYLMLRLRTVHGIARKEYETSFLMPFDPLERLLEFYGTRGLTKFDETEGRWRLTPQGFLVSNQLIGNLIEAQRKSTPLSPHRF